MDAVKFFRERKRMCDHMKSEYNCCNRACPLDPIRFKNNGVRSCLAACAEFPDEATTLVEKWSEANPQKLRKHDFLKKYPNAALESDGTPVTCAMYLGYCADCVNDCRLCWEKPIDE